MPIFLAVLALLSFLAAAMASGSMVATKTRVLISAVTVADGALGPFPAGFTTAATTAGDSRTSHTGDFDGCYIAAVELVVASHGGTSITPTFETSHDGITWTTWFAVAAITGNGTTTKYAEDDFESPKRFIRTSWANAAAGTGVVTINIRYAQVGARGAYAPPGLVDSHE